jgi:hypothetical protein
MKKQPVGVAIPRDADVGLLSHHFGGDVLAVLFNQRVGFVIGKRADRSRSATG